MVSPPLGSLVGVKAVSRIAVPVLPTTVQRAELVPNSSCHLLLPFSVLISGCVFTGGVL